MKDTLWLSDMRLLRWGILSCIVLACTSCYLPAVFLFTDTLLLPKWYLCMLSVALLLILYTWAKRQQIEVPTPWLLTTFQRSFLWVSYAECLYVLVLVCTQGVPEAGVTGTFDNPAGLSLNLCVALAIVAQRLKRKRVKAYGWVCCIVIMAVLLLTKSRTGLLCVTSLGLIYLYRHFLSRHSSVHKRHFLYTLTFIIMAGCCTTLFLKKKDSTSGRTFILKRSIELAMEHPLKGHGRRGFEREYMLRQADFFRKNPNCDYALLADEVHHPLNEFLYLWINFGIGAALGLALLMAMPYFLFFRFRFRQMKIVLLPLLIIIIFSCFSYPFHYPVTWLVLGTVLPLLPRWKMPHGLYMMPLVGCFLIGYIAVDATIEHFWERAYSHSYGSNRATSLTEYENLHGYMLRNPLFLYNYAMTAYRLHHFQRAYMLIGECTLYWNGYNRELLAGDICRNLQKYEEAIHHYKTAKAMCPVRYAPLEGLYRTYNAIGNEEERENVAIEIAHGKVKVNSPTIDRIKNTYK